VVKNGSKRYLRLLYYITHTYPYITAYKLENSKFVFRYPGDIPPSKSPTPFKRLLNIWNNSPQKFRCKEMVDATLGSIFLLQVEQVDNSKKKNEYIKTTLGNLDFFNQYNGIRRSLTGQAHLR
jgi:hypothetical protein